MIKCPECGARFVGRARRKRLEELLLSLLTIYPFRCQLCTHRFLAFRGRPTYSARREYRRVPVRCPVAFHATSASAEPGFEGEGMVIDLSIHGCSLESETPIPGAIRLHLRLTPADSPEAIQIKQAVVRYVRGRRVGVEFLELEPPDLGRLQRIIADHLSHLPLPSELT